MYSCSDCTAVHRHTSATDDKRGRRRSQAGRLVIKIEKVLPPCLPLGSLGSEGQDRLSLSSSPRDREAEGMPAVTGSGRERSVTSLMRRDGQFCL